MRGADGAYADYPAGWIGTAIYYLRVFADGRAELHRTGVIGENDELVWSTESLDFAGERPVATVDGVLIPTASSWLFVGADGGEGDRGANPYGAVATPLLSPFGSLVAYAAGGELVIAPVDSPGTALAAIPYDGASGFDFSPDGRAASWSRTERPWRSTAPATGRRSGPRRRGRRWSGRTGPRTASATWSRARPRPCA